MRILTLVFVVAATSVYMLGCTTTQAQQQTQQNPEPRSGETMKLENSDPAGSDSAAANQLSTPTSRQNVKPLDWNVTRGEVSADAQLSDELSSTAPGPAESTSGGAPRSDRS